ncbi:disease resistance protein Roq1-like [Corylus avellana]|uniref:disease resistance protein Roq1-like n=1 Tax=Corylus avellana TaxID=13451 RepID=UPI00286B884F|nr:disease resistance protein Roq1-like [Corylus avellana]
MKVQRWKKALTKATNLSRKHLENRNESLFIHEIIEWANSILVNKTYFQVAKYLVGIKSRVQDVKSLLDIEKNDRTCTLGIFGTGGIGKTTITKAIYNSIATQFECSFFLENVRETSGQKDGLIHLQNKLLSKILGGLSQMVDNVDQGITLIEQRLCLKKILLILKDVDHSDQLEKIVGKGDWFGLGSRIIITTRDKHLLTKHQVLAYEVKELDHYKSLQLFSWHAFNRDRPNDDYVEVTEDAVCYAGGLPLALTVLGSTLKGRDILYWKKYVTKVLDSRGFHSYSGIKELKDKCLITQSCGSLVMHDLVREMGREIVRQESPKEPGKRSRLWFHEDVRDVLEKNTGTNKVEGLLIDLPEVDLIHLSSKAFKKMKMLRLFISHNAHFYEEPDFLSNELRLLDWSEYSRESLPSNFRGKNLVVLRMSHSHLKKLEGVENFKNMTIMNFTNCKFLRKIPDVSSISNLERLILDGCKNLVEVHHSVGFLDKLVCLRLAYRSNLKSFPKSLKLQSLKFLSLLGCSRLKKFPEIECQMECLVYIDFQYTNIEELPSSIGYLIGIKTLDLSGCKNLKNIPNNIYQLQHLERLNLGGCNSLKGMPPYPSSKFEFLQKVIDNRQFMSSEILDPTQRWFHELGPIHRSDFLCLANISTALVSPKVEKKKYHATEDFRYYRRWRMIDDNLCHLKYHTTIGSS